MEMSETGEWASKQAGRQAGWQAGRNHDGIIQIDNNVVIQYVLRASRALQRNQVHGNDSNNDR